MDQLSEIHTINIGLVEFTVQFKVTGDMMFLTKIFAIQAQDRFFHAVFVKYRNQN